MDGLQNLTNTPDETVAFIDKAMAEKRKSDAVENKTDWRWDAWIDYRALNGTIIIYDENINPDKNGVPQGGETIKKMSITELAGKLGVSRDTLYEWEKTIPNFWDKVNTRHKQLASQRRVSFMRDKFYIKAMKWDDKFISIKWLEQNDPGWKDPRYKIEHEAGQSMVDLVRQLQQKKQGQIVEGEVVPTNEQ